MNCRVKRRQALQGCNHARDNLALIEPMFCSAGANPLALHTDNQKSHRTIDPHALKIPAPQGRTLH